MEVLLGLARADDPHHPRPLGLSALNGATVGRTKRTGGQADSDIVGAAGRVVEEAGAGGVDELGGGSGAWQGRLVRMDLAEGAW